MKFKIANLQRRQVKTRDGRTAEKFTFTNTHTGTTVDAWLKKGFTDQFANGYEFEADLNDKPYNGIYTVQWPKQQNFHAPIPKDFVYAQDPSIHAKLDEILRLLRNGREGQLDRSKEEAIRLNMKEPEIPYAGSPDPTDDDFKGY